MKNLTAVILAAGLGRRFWPLSEKVMFPFLGKPFLAHVLGSLPKEITKAVIVASPSNEFALKSLKLSFPVKIMVQEKPQGMGDALLTAQKELTDASLLVINGDDITEPSIFHGVLEKAKSSHAFGVIPGRKTVTYQDLGYVSLKGNKVHGIIEKPGKGNEPSKFIFIVSYFVRDSDQLIEALKQTKTERGDHHEKALSLLMQSHPLEFYEHKGQFASLKYPWHVLDVLRMLLQSVTPYKGTGVTVKNNVTIEGPVWIGDHATIYENTKIIGPTYIGPHAIIGNNNIIRESHIGAHCVTGFNTDITRSYIGDNCWFHSNYIGDSVLEGNVSMGSGAVLANLRLDEGEINKAGRTKLGAMIGSDVRIGVNASVMPGVKIGTNSLIGAGVVLDKDLENNSFAIGKTEVLIKKNARKVTVRTYV